MIGIATGYIRLSPMSVASTMLYGKGKRPVAWKEYCAEYWLKELQESIDTRRDITEIMLKTALNAIQSILQVIGIFYLIRQMLKEKEILWMHYID